MSERALLIREPTTDWASTAFRSLLPGGFVAVFGDFRIPFEGEDQGFVVRDCLSVIGPVCHRIWLIRRPLAQPTVVAQVLSTQTGALWVEGCRVRGVPRAPGHYDNHQENSEFRRTGGYAGSDAREYTRRVESGELTGRWPTNLVLVHTQGCQEQGVSGPGQQWAEGGNRPAHCFNRISEPT